MITPSSSNFIKDWFCWMWIIINSCIAKIWNNKRIRVGGIVKEETIKLSQNKISFVITDFKNEINVTYSGAIPNLFSEGKGVIAEGKLKDRKYFIADKILAKHDENYMPPEVKKALDESKY